MSESGDPWTNEIKELSEVEETLKRFLDSLDETDPRRPQAERDWIEAMRRLRAGTGQFS